MPVTYQQLPLLSSSKTTQGHVLANLHDFAGRTVAVEPGLFGGMVDQVTPGGSFPILELSPLPKTKEIRDLPPPPDLYWKG